MSKKTCHHCGLSCDSTAHNLGDKIFCCLGCKSVFQLLKSHNLEAYYTFQKMPGQKPKSTAYEYLDAIEFREKLIEFSDASGIQIITLTIPSINCSSCIWVLEHLQRLDSGVKKVVVNFNKKTARIHFNELEISLKNLAELLNKIGYPPHIYLENLEQKKESKDRSLIYKIAVSGFAFGLGTVPLMTSVVYAFHLFSVKTQQIIRNQFPVLVIILAGLFILRGLGLDIPYLSPAPIDFVYNKINCH